MLLVTVILLTVGVLAAPSDDFVVLYYSFDEIVDGRVMDQSGNGINGMVCGTVNSVQGVRGLAGQFVGKSFVDLSGFPSALIPKDEISIMAWIKVSPGETREIFNTQSSDETWVFHPEVRADGKYRWLVRTSNMQTIFDMQVGEVTWDSWVHFSAVYSATEGYGALYINGEEVFRQQVAKGIDMIQDWGKGARIGLTINDGRPFGGTMDDFIIWNKALQADEIRCVMENGVELGAN